MGPIKSAVSKGPRARAVSEKHSLKKTNKTDEKKLLKDTKRKHKANVKGLSLNKVHGQHLLRNPGITKKIVSACQLVPSDLVLEIGPGTGNLTVEILPRCLRVTAVDIDERMIVELRRRVAQKGYSNLMAYHSDALRYTLPNFHVCTANMPYKISSPFIFKLVKHLKSGSGSNFKRAVLMFQKEYSDRLMAQPGDKNYCRLSVNVQLFFKVKKVCDVNRKSFNPPPKVDSMVVSLEPLQHPVPVDYIQWDGMLRILFSRKNRTLRASLAGSSAVEGLGEIYNEYALAGGRPPITDKEQFKQLIELCIDQSELRDCRARSVSQLKFLELLTRFAENHIYFVTLKDRVAELDVSMLEEEQ